MAAISVYSKGGGELEDELCIYFVAWLWLTDPDYDVIHSIVSLFMSM